MKRKLNICFVATRLAGTDGVSLEAAKWRDVLSGLGHHCHCFCGESDWSAQNSYVVPEANFLHPDVLRINDQLFNQKKRDRQVVTSINKLKDQLVEKLARFNRQNKPDLFIVENALSLPMNVPFGLAVTEFLAQNQTNTIAHHHDFWWERQRYLGSVADDYLASAFPPATNCIRHVVINSVAQKNLAYRTGLSAILVPNVMDFNTGPETKDAYADDLRETLGVGKSQHFVLQPTRIVPRKRIEMAIELIRKLGDDSVLIITHHDGDEGDGYKEYLRTFADMVGARTLMVGDRFDQKRGRDDRGRKIYSLKDAYQEAELVTYCSKIEGFGNAFLETIYYKRPLLMSAYEIFALDIMPKGFKVLAFRDFIPQTMVQQARDILDDPREAEEWAEHNFALGKRYYSIESLEKKLDALLEECLGKC